VLLRVGSRGSRLALTQAERACELDPLCLVVGSSGALVHYLVGDYDSAIAAYERFVELAPDDPTTTQVKERIKLLEPFAESSG